MTRTPAHGGSAPDPDEDEKPHPIDPPVVGSGERWRCCCWSLWSRRTGSP
uniref:Uncharacterized protein n=1 Tax=Arundo donax TaxID=35708 RepID=A0A0A9GRC7_ARUDO